MGTLVICEAARPHVWRGGWWPWEDRGLGLTHTMFPHCCCAVQNMQSLGAHAQQQWAAALRVRVCTSSYSGAHLLLCWTLCWVPQLFQCQALQKFLLAARVLLMSLLTWQAWATCSCTFQAAHVMRSPLCGRAPLLRPSWWTWTTCCWTWTRQPCGTTLTRIQRMTTWSPLPMWDTHTHTPRARASAMPTRTRRAPLGLDCARGGPLPRCACCACLASRTVTAHYCSGRW